jgi:hypothetical protein
LKQLDGVLVAGLISELDALVVQDGLDEERLPSAVPLRTCKKPHQ